MRIVTARELESWLASGKVLEQDARGAKVVALPDGRFLKIFHTRRNRLLAMLWPAARRFAQNTKKLKALGIPTPEVTELLWVDRRTGLSACIYSPLPGDSLENLLNQSPETLQHELPALAGFIHHLHRNGVYFRSLHLGNILRLTPGRFGLIDVLDLRLHRRALGDWQVKRNFQHLHRYLIRRKLERFPLQELLDQYARHATDHPA